MSLKQRQKHQQRRVATLHHALPSFPLDETAARMATALQLHQRGDIASAEIVYREVLYLHPQHADALHYLGMARYQRRHLAEAAELMERSIAAVGQHGGRAAFYSNFGLVLHDLGKLKEASAAFGNALRLRPNYPEALNNLGNTLQAQGKLDEALAHYQRAIALQPGYVRAYCNAGAVLKKQELLAEAEQAYRTALGLSPGDAESHYNLGNTLYAQDRMEEAVCHYRSALAEKPDYTEVHVNWGNVLMDQGRWDEAIAQYEQALVIDPHWPEAHRKLGNNSFAQGKREKACDPEECAVMQEPQDATDRFMQDERSSDPPKQENVIAHMNLAMAHLVSGNFAEGLAHYEWRHHSASPARARAHPQPMWRGGALAGATILLHCEQGLGDTLHLLRYAPMVHAHGGRVVLEVQPCLERLAASMSPKF